MTKQDEIANPYPKERTVEFLSGPFVVFGSKRALPKFCKSKDNTEFELYNGHAVKFNIPLNDAGIALYDKRIKSKELLSKWQLGFSGNLSLDIYKNILPNELFKMPRIFYHDMRNVPYANISSNIKYENVVVDVWIYTVALFVCWQFFSEPLKKALKSIMRNYATMYANALEALVEEVGPKSAFTVMEWTKKNLSRRLGLIYNSDISCVLDAECLFHFYQNEYDLPEELLIYSIDAINEFGGYERLKEEYLKANSQRKIYIVNCLEKIESALQLKKNLKSDDGVKSVAKKLK